MNQTVMLPHLLDNRKAYEELFLLIDECKKFAEICSKYNDEVKIGVTDSSKIFNDISELKNSVMEIYNKIGERVVRADEAEAVAASDNDKIMTPLMVKKYTDSKSYLNGSEIETLVASKQFAEKKDVFRYLGVNNVDIANTQDSSINYTYDFTDGIIHVFGANSGKIINFGGPNYHVQIALSSLGEIAARGRKPGQNFCSWKRSY